MLLPRLISVLTEVAEFRSVACACDCAIAAVSKRHTASLSGARRIEYYLSMGGPMLALYRVEQRRRNCFLGGAHLTGHESQRGCTGPDWRGRRMMLSNAKGPGPLTRSVARQAM